MMTHIVAGYPTLKESENIAIKMLECGVDFLEIQIPFSDPVADGPTIMRANDVALRNGVKLKDCFELMEKIHKIFPQAQLLFMTYFNVIYKHGVEKFCKKVKACGCYGLIVPDMPIYEEKNEHYLAACKKYGLNPIQIISPLTTVGRLKKLSKYARGFVYCVSRYGTTGQSKSLNPKLAKYLKTARKYFKIPLAVGFGISKKEHVQAVHKYAEIAVVGSRIINAIDKKEDINKLLRNFRN